MLEFLPIPPADPLFGQVSAYKNDPCQNKMDLIVGVYRNHLGATPTMKVVKGAERQLAEASASKAYKALSGNAEFNSGMAELLLGQGATALKRQHTMQTVGGTGALMLLANFIAIATPNAVVWNSDPGYVNHEPILRSAGLSSHRYAWRERNGMLDVDAVIDTLKTANAGDVVLLHGACHNPTGIHMPIEAWKAIAEFCEHRNLIPFVDMAYQGFGDGMDADAQGLRLIVKSLPTVLIAASCSKNMGLYCERTGSATVVATEKAALSSVAGTLENIARAAYSMPPEHGAAVAALLFRNPEPWLQEVEEMRMHISSTRHALAKSLEEMGAPEKLISLRNHKGMFSMLPLNNFQMAELRNRFSIYGASNGRINIAGIAPTEINKLAEAMVSVSNTACVMA